MTKTEMVERIAEKINLTKKETERVVNIVFGSIIQALASGLRSTSPYGHGYRCQRLS